MRVEAGSRSVDNYLQQLNGEASADNRQCQRPDQFASAKAGRKDPEQGHGEEYLHSAQLRERYQRRDAGRMRGSPSYEVADDNHVGPEGRTAYEPTDDNDRDRNKHHGCDWRGRRCANWE